MKYSLKYRTLKAIVPFLLAAAAFFAPALASAQSLKVYGPGGPAPTIKELATAFAKTKGIQVDVTAGPTPTWLPQAKGDAHVIFSGADNMMLDFIRVFEGQIQQKTIEPLYLRPSTLLVRKGNPKGVKGIRDLVRPGLKVLVTEGAGQVGLWEDVVGRTGDLNLLKSVRANIVEFAANSGLALKSWKEKPEIDAWLIWNHWQIANADVADQVAVEPDLAIWRSTGVALTKRGTEMPAAAEFIQFLKSSEGEAVFKKWGWRR
ncbi:MAG: substrate-binding domain-containing protein [Hyphomicrobiaceae bacterium]